MENAGRMESVVGASGQRRSGGSACDHMPEERDDRRFIPEGRDARRKAFVITRKSKGLSRYEWTKFCIRLCLAKIQRTCKFMKYAIRFNCKTITSESLQGFFDDMGGVCVKCAQFVVENNELNESALKYFGNDKECMKVLGDTISKNKAAPIDQMIKVMKKNQINFDSELQGEITHLGVGSVADVISVHMENEDDPLALKVVRPKAEIDFLADISIIKKGLSLLSFFKPDVLGKGEMDALTGFLDTMPAECDLTKEAANIKLQQQAFDDVDNNTNLFNFSETEQGGSSSSIHGDNEKDQIYFLPISRPKQQIRVGNEYAEIEYKVPAVVETCSSTAVMAMGKINGATLDQPKGVGEVLCELFPNRFEGRVDKEALDVYIQYIKGLALKKWEYTLQTTGVFNADMHGGNIMIAAEDGKLIIYLIDFGNTCQLEKETIRAIYIADGAIEKALDSNCNDEDKRKHIEVLIDQMKVFCIDIGKKQPDWETIAQKAEILINESAGLSSIDVIREIFNISFKYGARTPPEITGMFRAKMVLNA